jgi:hypothetical protein
MGIDAHRATLQAVMILGVWEIFSRDARMGWCESRVLWLALGPLVESSVGLSDLVIVSS